MRRRSHVAIFGPTGMKGKFLPRIKSYEPPGYTSGSNLRRRCKSCNQLKYNEEFHSGKNGLVDYSACRACYKVQGRTPWVPNNPNWGKCASCGEPARLDYLADHDSLCYECHGKRWAARTCDCGRQFYSPLHDQCWPCRMTDIQFGDLTLSPCAYCRQFFPPEGFAKGVARRGAKCLGCSSRSAVIASLPRDLYTSREIANRDNWTCGLCGEGIDQSLTDVFDPGYLNIDHITPVTHPRFPGDIRSNVQASHRLCNIKKGGYKMEAKTRS